MKHSKRFILFIIKESQKNHVINLSAQMSYRALLAFIPFLMLMYNFINWISGELNSTLLLGLSKIFPKSIMDYMNTAMENAINTPISLGTNLVFGFFILYVSISAMHSLIYSLNKIFHQEENRGIFALWIQSILYLFLFLILIISTLFFYAFGEKLLSFIFMSFNLPKAFSMLVTVFGATYLLLVMTFIFTLIYKFAPKTNLDFFHALPGGFFVALGWMFLFYLYQFFASSLFNFAQVLSDFQGPFSLVILIFLVCLLIILGALVNLFIIENQNLKKERI